MGRADDSLGQAELKALSLSQKLSRKDGRKHEDKKGGGLGNVYGQTWPGMPGLVKPGRRGKGKVPDNFERKGLVSAEHGELCT